MKYNLNHIKSLEKLHREQQVVRERIKAGESELRLKMYEIPGELAAAGANTLIPKMLRGKITDAALNTGKKLIHGFFSPGDTNNQNLLTYAAKKPAGVLNILKKGFNLWRGKK